MTARANWNLPAPPGFQAFDPAMPVRVYQRHLPHWRQPGATYFVTFRLGDSLPKVKLDELAAFKSEWERRHPPPLSNDELEDLWRETFRRVDRWLDQGYGNCWLRRTDAAAIVTQSLHHFDDERYELGCYVVMPNHVHLIVRPLDDDDDALERITHGWKRFMARQINNLVGLAGTLWQQESYDRIVRDEEHLWRVVQYIGSNPRNADLSQQECPRWIRPSWRELGWRFEDDT
jgi:REP element-mobilizing transposase RayT